MANWFRFASLLSLAIAAHISAQAPQAVAQSWAGWARCEITIQAPGYSHRETHLWTMTGPGTRTGNLEIYPTTWTVTGSGSLQRVSGPTRVAVEWTVNGTLPNVTIGATVHVDRITVQRWTNHGPARGGLTGTEISTTNGVAPIPRAIVLDVQQWAFPGVETGTTSTRATGSNTVPFNGLRGPMNPPSGAVGTAACTWDFARGGESPSVPPPPSATPPVTPPPGAPVSGGAPSSGSVAGAGGSSGSSGTSGTSGTSGGATAGAPGGATSSSTPGGTSPSLALSVSPSSALPGTRALTVSITGSGTHFERTSWVDFGELVGATSFVVTSPTSATAVIDIDPAAPAGPRTVSVMTPSATAASLVAETATLANGFTVGVPATSGRYRISAARLKFHREEPDFRARLHGRNNEVFVTKHAQVVDRRNNTKLENDLSTWSTPTHGDSNSTESYSDPRVPAGSFAPSGGIQTGDDIEIWTAGDRPYPWGYQYRIIQQSEYVPFVLWSGELHDGIEVVLVRPVVWINAGAGHATEFGGPYHRRLEAEQSVDFLGFPAIRDALNQPGIRVPTVPELVTPTRWLGDENRPIGLDVTGNYNGAPATWTDRVVVLTREKIEALLTGSVSRLLEIPIRGRMTGANAIPLGDVSLFLKIERLP